MVIVPSGYLPAGITFPRNMIGLKWYINSAISRFIAVKDSGQPVPELPTVSNELDAVGHVLPFKDQASADIVREQLKNLSQKIQVTVQPPFVSHMRIRYLKLRKVKPSIVNH